jgi:alkaline phosphatase D
MRIAFASCMFNRVYATQPVWDWIAAQQPDHLVLLGDSTYFDVDAVPHPRDMDDWGFAQHAHGRYAELISQPEFAGLVKAMPAGTVHAIWDDHDFLWDNANGAEPYTRTMHGGKIRYSTALLEAFRAALAQQLAPGSFPAAPGDGAFWDMNQPPLRTPSLQLAPDVWLHLSDGRSNRTSTFLVAESRRTMFGDAQKAAFSQAITAAPLALHLWASGSTMGGYQRYTRDVSWLMGLAARQRLLMLSGDIHRNAIDAFSNGAGRFPLHEATSSGAAVKDGVIVGARRRNFGLLDIGPQQVDVRLFKDNVAQTPRTIFRQPWLP